MIEYCVLRERDYCLTLFTLFIIGIIIIIMHFHHHMKLNQRCKKCLNKKHSISLISICMFFRVLYLQRRDMSGKSFQEMLDTVLVVMAARGDARKVAELLSQGGRVNARDENGFIPLLAAAQGGHHHHF